MDTTDKNEWDAELRALDCADTISSLIVLFEDYIDNPHGGASDSFERVRSLMSKIDEVQTHKPFVEHRRMEIVIAVAGVYRRVSAGQVADEDQQRQAHEEALGSLDVLSGAPARRKIILDGLVRSRSDIRARNPKNRSGGGPRETAKVVVGQLRPQLLAWRPRAHDLSDYSAVVGRDAMDALCRRAEARGDVPRYPKTVLTLLRLLVDSVLEPLIDQDLLESVHEAALRAIEEQAGRESGPPAPAKP